MELQAIIDYIRTRRGERPRICQETGVAGPTLDKIMCGSIKNPRYNTYWALRSWCIRERQKVMEEAAVRQLNG